MWGLSATAAYYGEEPTFLAAYVVELLLCECGQGVVGRQRLLEIKIASAQNLPIQHWIRSVNLLNFSNHTHAPWIY